MSMCNLALFKAIFLLDVQDVNELSKQGLPTLHVPLSLNIEIFKQKFDFLSKFQYQSI
jgi:hypothetical protein